MIPAGTRVRIRITPSGIAHLYPVASWVKNEQTVLLLDDAPNENTLDVLDVRPQLEHARSGDYSIYDFNIIGVVE